jgi:hypothetical protein
MTGTRQGDFSRVLSDPRRRDRAVRMQQGRVQLDADWNAQADVLLDLIEAGTRDLVGAHGGPAGAAGFALAPRYGLLFDGADDFVAIGGSGVAGWAPEEGVTIEVRMRPSPGGALVARAVRRPGGGFQEDLLLAVTRESRRVRLHRAATAHPDLVGESSLSESAFSLVSAVCGRTGCRLYVDGARIAADGVACPAAPGADVLLRLGGAWGLEGLADPFGGLIHELRLWRGTRSDEEVRSGAERRVEAGEPGLLGLWRFDGGHGERVPAAGGGPAAVLGGDAGAGARPTWLLGDLVIEPGRYYVDGVLCGLDRPTPFARQADLPDAALPPLAVRPARWLFFLDVWERTVDALQEPSLSEVALGGTDTTVRSRLVAQVRYLPLGGRDGGRDGGGRGAEAADPSAGEEWRELVSRAERRGRLAARRTDSVATLGNFLYRVEIHHGGVAGGSEGGEGTARGAAGGAASQAASGEHAALEVTALGERRAVLAAPVALLVGQAVEISAGGGVLVTEVVAVARDRRTLALAHDPSPLAAAAEEADAQASAAVARLRAVATFKWSRLNASLAWPIERLDPGGRTVWLGTGGSPQVELVPGDVVEVVDDRSALRGQPGSLLRVAAVDAVHRRVTVAAPYQGPQLDPDHHPLLRRWDHGGAAAGERTTPGGALAVRAGEWLPLEAGVEVRFAGDGPYRSGDFWWLLARTATGGVTWADGGAIRHPRRPDGVDHRHAPLALLDVDDDGYRLRDLRRLFPPAVAAGGGGRDDGAGEDGGGDRGDGGERHHHHHHHHRPPDPGSVGSEALADGAVTPAKLSPAVPLLPPEALLVTAAERSPAGWQATGLTLRAEPPRLAFARWLEVPWGEAGRLDALVAGDELFVLAEGGALWSVDLASGRWQGRRPLPAPRRAFAACAAQGRLWVSGGFDGEDRPSADLHVYDPAADAWSARTPLPTPRAAHAMAAAGDLLFAVGGLERAFLGPRVTGRTDAYDPLLDEWSPRRPLAAPRSGLRAAALAGRLYAVGGERRFLLARWGAALAPDCEEHDPAADLWTPRAPLAAGRRDLALAEAGGRLWAVGGVAAEGASAAVEEYDPAAGAWRPREPLADTVAAPGAAGANGALMLVHAVGDGGPERWVVEGAAVAETLWVHRREG